MFKIMVKVRKEDMGKEEEGENKRQEEAAAAKNTAGIAAAGKAAREGVKIVELRR